ncbi:hypothetical protein [Candidatus Vondammii sp. HM_W22]|uniref:hypothetical protein n=1 Tax=Candidatus Vondammii sp. HM_W22 TaxID=2687299 RepID=UPI002E7B38B4|nr:hypothetical protein [Candidatus Vondammii sp. HM_W22]
MMPVTVPPVSRLGIRGVLDAINTLQGGPGQKGAGERCIACGRHPTKPTASPESPPR